MIHALHSTFLCIQDFTLKITRIKSETMNVEHMLHFVIDFTMKVSGFHSRTTNTCVVIFQINVESRNSVKLLQIVDYKL